MYLQSVTPTTVFFHSLIDLVVVTVDLKQNVQIVDVHNNSVYCRHARKKLKYLRKKLRSYPYRWSESAPFASAFDGGARVEGGSLLLSAVTDRVTIAHATHGCHLLHNLTLQFTAV